MGRLIPAGTGFEYYRHVRIPGGRPAAAGAAAAERRGQDLEIEYSFDADEPMAGRVPSGDVE